MNKSKKDECECCGGTGIVVTGVTGKFNARSMDFDIVDQEEECQECDASGYIDAMEEDYWEARAEYEREETNNG